MLMRMRKLLTKYYICSTRTAPFVQPTRHCPHPTQSVYVIFLFLIGAHRNRL